MFVYLFFFYGGCFCCFFWPFGGVPDCWQWQQQPVRPVWLLGTTGGIVFFSFNEPKKRLPWPVVVEVNAVIPGPPSITGYMYVFRDSNSYSEMVGIRRNAVITGRVEQFWLLIIICRFPLTIIFWSCGKLFALYLRKCFNDVGYFTDFILTIRH